jgi:C4-dicarboxylate-binding protein DctP
LLSLLKFNLITILKKKEEFMKTIGKCFVFSIALLALLLASIVQLSIGAEVPIIIKLAHQYPINDPVTKGADYFAKQLAERTKGEVKVDLYPASMLYKDTEIAPAVRDGAIQMGFCTVNQLESLVPIAEVLSIPFLSATPEAGIKTEQGKVGKMLIDKVSRIGLKHVFWIDFGFTDLFTTKKLVKKPEDLQGLKIRVVGGKIASETIKALGAAPVFISSAEVYMALSRGVMDGYLTAFNSFYARKNYEVAKYATKFNLFYGHSFAIINMKFWESLHNEIKEAIQEVGRDAEDKVREWAEEQEIESISKCKEKGTIVYYPTNEEKILFTKAVQPVWEDFSKRYGREGEELLQWIRANQ